MFYLYRFLSNEIKLNRPQQA